MATKTTADVTDTSVDIAYCDRTTSFMTQHIITPLHISPVCILNFKHTMHTIQTDVGMISIVSCLLRKRETGC